MAHKTIEVPHQVDCLQGILTIIPMQLLSLHIAELRNCDVSAITDFYHVDIGGDRPQLLKYRTAIN